jgi:putative Ca2+/H+ antiporter (TMEM165/GDT1 family)
MLLGRTLICFAGFLWTSNGSLLESSPNLNALSGAGPHAVVFDLGRSKEKKDIIYTADVEVSDKDTVPVEDMVPSAHAVGAALKSEENVGAQHSASKPDAAASITSTKATGAASIRQEVNAEDPANDPSSQSPFLMAISMIVVSEIGDKTFLISALMAMRHSRALVFSASFASLAIMTILSGVVGHALPSLISQRVTQFLAAGLFIVFGVKLTREGLEMSKDLGVDEELAEVEEELTVSDRAHDLDNLESGRQGNHSVYGKSTTYKQKLLRLSEQAQEVASLVFSPLWVQVFVMIFLGEWGDRSQIATIAMAAGFNYWAVICGAVIGHGLCTLAAVIGGKMLASRISMRTVTLGGAFAFFVFAILYFHEAYYGTREA